MASPIKSPSVSDLTAAQEELADIGQRVVRLMSQGYLRGSYVREYLMAALLQGYTDRLERLKVRRAQR